MSKLTKVGYELCDVNVVQAPISYVDHRAECNPYVRFEGIDKDYYPVIVSPMGAVTNEYNYQTWIDEKFMCVIPRTVDLEKRFTLVYKCFVSFSLSEAEEHLPYIKIADEEKAYVCIDIAHGTMNRLYDICDNLKAVWGDKIVIMTGNVANPHALWHYANIGIDYLRACIGTGSRCVCAGTRVTMSDGSTKNIEDINVGDLVKTTDGECEVINTFHNYTDKTVVVNNNIECTPDHKFLVVRKTDLPVTGRITDEKIKELSFYVNAENLTNEYFLVKEKFRLVEITSIELKNVSKDVYDIEVKEKHQYCANGYFVHNCTTSCNVSVHYPTATLLDELRMEKERWEECYGRKCPTKIIADGGIANFDDIQKCLALGADLVMSGSIFAKSWEACGDVVCLHPTNANMIDAIPYDKWVNKKDELIKTIHELREDEDTFKDVIASKKETLAKLENRRPYREYYGMSTKRAQRETGGSGKTTAEGISRPIPIEYHINKWADNMKSFLISAMSYTDSKTLKEFGENTELIINLSGDKQFRK